MAMLAISAEKLANRPTSAPRICLGAEVLYCEGLERMPHLNDLCIQGTNVLLLELPITPWSESLFDTVGTLLRDFRVVLAHIDRYLPKHREEIEVLLDMGALAQINTDALAGLFGKSRISPFLTDERVVALGSDLHGTDSKAVDRFSAAEKKLGNTHKAIMARSADLLKNAKTI